MSYRTVPGSRSRYALVAFGADGRERDDDADASGVLFSERVAADVASARPSDVFVFCHGWKGDVPAAEEQYGRWIAAMEGGAGLADAGRRRPGFSPFWIGVHWPSQPWGDEELGSGDASFLPSDPVDLYVARLGDRPGLREAVTAVFAAAARDPAADRLPPDAEAAYRRIDALLTEVGSEGEAAAPGDDREPFDAHAYFEVARGDAEADFGFGDLGGILGPLRQLSFWKMKERARTVGEGGMHAFLVSLLQAGEGAGTRVHLMGHSFGCIVVSAMLCGPAGTARPLGVHSLALVQGALSHWSYCKDIPVAPGIPGYFSRLLDAGTVLGPIVTTRSVHDAALSRFYPLGAGVADEVSFGPGGYPRYGALGAFGAQALAPRASDLAMEAAGKTYPFEPGHVYNLEASMFIRKGEGASGAHNDIDGPEVAHMIWSAALAGT